MSEAVIVAIVAVASTLFLAAAGAIWRLASSSASQSAQLAVLQTEVVRLQDWRAKHEDAHDAHDHEDRRWAEACTANVAGLMGEIRALQNQHPLRREARRSRPDSER